MTQIRKIAILGSTGSVGTQALEVISSYRHMFSVEVLTTNQNINLLAEQIKTFKPKAVVVGNSEKADEIADFCSKHAVKLHKGLEALSQIVTMSSIDVVLSAIVGYSGLLPTINAIKSGKDVALANKESLVIAGDMIQHLAQSSNVKILPVDSEHSALFQCLTGENEKQIEKIYLTASGGPFRNLTMEELETVTIQQALDHPNWDMGNKITIDSASLMNKGFEAIEAKWLFNLDPEQIDIIIHHQSIIHSIVQFVDGSMKAQMGLPDMKLPILYALTYPERVKTDFKRFDFADFKNLTFEKPDTKKFRNLALAYEAMKKGGNMPCILNASNEIAVEGFLKEKISFTYIPSIVEEAMQKTFYVNKPNLEDYMNSDKEARIIASELILNKVK
ncbi:MAG: 1-deoxy-D-xylulose-5-phosphate reductoisomerase [Bacteroidales bacterium]